METKKISSLTFYVVVVESIFTAKISGFWFSFETKFLKFLVAHLGSMHQLPLIGEKNEFQQCELDRFLFKFKSISANPSSSSSSSIEFLRVQQMYQVFRIRA